MRRKKNSSSKSFVKIRARQFNSKLIEKLVLKISENQGGFDYFQTKTESWRLKSPGAS